MKEDLEKKNEQLNQPETKEGFENRAEAESVIVNYGQEKADSLNNKINNDIEVEEEFLDGEDISGIEKIDKERKDITREGIKQIEDTIYLNENNFTETLTDFASKDMTKIENEANLSFDELTEHLNNKNPNNLYKIFKKNLNEILKPNFKKVLNKFSKIQMSKASLLALIIFLNANPEAISEKSNDEKEEATKIENIESIIDNIVSSYEVSEEDFEKVNPLENLKVEDEDFFLRGNREIIEKYEIKVEQKFIEIGQEKFLINILSKEGPNNQKYFICHDSEDASFDTAIRAIKNGGEVISLGNDENRFLFNYNEPKGLTNQDPNRMFSENNPYWPMAEKVLDLLESENKEMIIALHNNSPHGNFHLDNIKNWRNISIMSEEDPNKKSLIWIPGLEENPSDELLEEIEYYKKMV